MTQAAVVTVLCLMILGVAALSAWSAIRKDPRDANGKRGALPGTGYHEIDASYHSGGAGGGQSGSFKVPRDPQEYARQFIPRNRTSK